MKVTPEGVKPLARYHELADTAMRPLMFALGKFKSDSIQETHPWHIQNVAPANIEPALSVVVVGDKEAVSNRFGPLFHMFGGWKHYIVLEAKPPFHIGWVHMKAGQETPAQSAVNRLRIDDVAVRMLAGPEDTETTFFALNPDGEQIKLRKIGRGVLGDNQFPETRLL